MNRRIAVGVAIGLLAVLGWVFRYETIKPGGGAHYFYKHNRWTGELLVCFPTGCREAKPQP